MQSTAQASFRLPRRIYDEIEQLAQEWHMSKSQLVREALEYFLQQARRPTRVVRERGAPLIGAVRLSERHGKQDAVSALIRQRNWRD